MSPFYINCSDGDPECDVVLFFLNIDVEDELLLGYYVKYNDINRYSDRILFG